MAGNNTQNPQSNSPESGGATMEAILERLERLTKDNESLRQEVQELRQAAPAPRLSVEKSAKQILEERRKRDEEELELLSAPEDEALKALMSGEGQIYLVHLADMSDPSNPSRVVEPRALKALDPSHAKSKYMDAMRITGIRESSVQTIVSKASEAVVKEVARIMKLPTANLRVSEYSAACRNLHYRKHFGAKMPGSQDPSIIQGQIVVS